MAIDVPRKPIEVDEAPAKIDNHAFEPRGAWYTLCRHCGYAEAAHTATMLDAEDHAFEPSGAWYTLCKYCGLPESSHEETTVRQIDHVGYFGDDDD